MHRYQLETNHLKTKTQTDLKLQKKMKTLAVSYTKKKEENIMSP